MDQLVAHKRAQDAFAGVLANVETKQLDAQTPCADWNVRDLIAHVIGGNHRVSGSSPPASSDLAGLVEAYGASANAAEESFAAPDGLTRIIEMPFGSVPGSVLIGMRTTDVITHAWDLARATEQSPDIDPEVAEAALEASKMRLSDDFRGPGKPFGLRQPCDDDRPAADRLAAYLGRSVD